MKQSSFSVLQASKVALWQMPITYHPFPDSLLDQNTFLSGLARLVDLGRLAGNADIALLRSQFPGLLTMDEWFAGAGKPALLSAAVKLVGDR
ncbi:hypothetical protein A6769_31770 [Nostoc punctiforme NIES-2108]|uniref:Uncharacterized protein n=1 Tax=Nostoc punctiforme NIES-2108 TaxID=1356359 RepID=A0A367R4C2_NOSPU|nr:hypothetical protein A6769_31770 [Nostoc punctiforme NIES-2108]